MSEEKSPEWFLSLKRKHRGFIEAVEELGKVTRREGPLDEKTVHLIQLGAAATLRSEGAVHSHVRRALEAGAKPEEIRHAIMVLTSTIGFPNIAAALKWAEDLITEKEGSV
jgi:4-carboxymuconolactone decarboxylase